MHIAPDLVNNPYLTCDTTQGCVDPSGGAKTGAGYVPQGWSAQADGGGNFANVNYRGSQGIKLSDSAAVGDTSLWQDIGTTVGSVYRISYRPLPGNYVTVLGLMNHLVTEADPCYSDGSATLAVTFGTDTLESNPISSCSGISRPGTGIRTFFVNATSATSRFQMAAAILNSNSDEFYNQCAELGLPTSEAD